ncbi:hypothetical protein [Patulibacter sp.]|uniref:hypothetical protein n=1 Tax=Patulibacter sp. TaxID=1912859 RepID=UPI002716E9A3|nr:hypothetical protein [Patulibacter sp.]MDO9409746.1 hypothetical protein [Patulibacter sp.]
MLSLKHPHTRRAVGGTLLAGVVAAGLTVGVVGPAGAEDAPDRVAVAPDAQPAAIGAVQADQAQTLRVLRRAKRATDVMPAAAAAAVSPARFGRNPGLARAIDTPNGRGWVVPGDDTVCLIAPDPVDGYGVTCSPTSMVATDGITLGMTSEDHSTAFTLVPDGAEVTVVDEDRTSQQVTPDASGVVAVDAEQVDHLEIATSDGVADKEISDAADFAGSTP